MKFELKSLATQNSQQWSGGQTTELYLFPKEAVYQKQNFDYRLSTATVEKEKCQFTSLPGYKRILMILEGQIELTHTLGEVSNQVLLKRLEQTVFSGDEQTESFGRCQDFNLIFKQSMQATMVGRLSNESWSIYPKCDHLIYCIVDHVMVTISGQKFNLKKNDLLICSDNKEKVDADVESFEHEKELPVVIEAIVLRDDD